MRWRTTSATPPFGHAGEDALRRRATRRTAGSTTTRRALRTLMRLEMRRIAEHDGLNLTWEVLEGLAKHNGPVARAELGAGSGSTPPSRSRSAQLALAGGAGRGESRTTSPTTTNPALLPEPWRVDGDGDAALRTIGDFIAGMTDRFAIRRHEELVGPVNLPADRF